MSNFTHPFTTKVCISRLLYEYQLHGKLIVAFDFDNTIFDYHDDGGDYSCVIDLLKECQELNFELVLMTTANEPQEEFAKYVKCKEMGIRPNYINSHPLFPKAKKPYYNILLDDRAGLEESYNILRSVVDAINTTEE